MPPLWRLLAVVALAGAAWALPVDLRRGRSGGIFYAWGETAFLVGVVLVSPGWLVPATAVGVGLTFFARHPLLKTAYNVATYTVAAAAAAAILQFTGIPVGRFGWPQVLALAAAGVVFSVVCQLLISAVVAVASGQRLVAVLAEEGSTQLLVMAGNIAAGIAVVLLFDWQHNLLVVLPVAAWALRHAYMTTARLSDAQQTARQLETITGRMNSLDVATVLSSLISGAARLFRADRVELVLDGPVGQGMVGGDRQGVREIDDELDDEFVPAQVHVLDLTSGTQTLGQLRLLFAATVELTGTERGTLATLVAAGGSALLNARQHESTAHEATTDTLTGLANRRALLAAGERWITTTTAVLLLVDLDRFRDINDTLGHAAGDELLTQVAGRLRTAAGEDALVCRLGGDEFAVLLVDPADADSRGQELAARLSAALAEPAEVDDVTVSVHGSIGVACAPRDAGDVAELLRCADVAMYEAKRAGADVRRYQARQQSGSVRSLSLEPDLRAALRADDQLVVLFQPQLDLSTGHAIGAEALVRWRHPLHGVLSPAAFLPTVHRAGLSGQLTRYVLEAALTARTGWQQLTGVDVPVAVNLAAKDLFDPTLPADVGAALARHATAPDRLVLEIPETVVLTELDVITAVLSALAGLGVQLSIDDFGAGGVPLSLLARVPIREIKIDQSFVRTLPTSPTSATIVRALIQLAHALEVRVVAEGVETAEQEDELRGMGCDAGQGLRYDRPLDAHEAAFALKSPAGVPMPHPGAEVLRMPAGRRRRPS